MSVQYILCSTCSFLFYKLYSHVHFFAYSHNFCSVDFLIAYQAFLFHVDALPMWPTKMVGGGLAELYSWVLQGKQKYLHHVLILCSKQWFRDLISTFEPWRSEEIGSSANRKEYIHRIPPGSIIYRHFLSKHTEKSYGLNTFFEYVQNS